MWQAIETRPRRAPREGALDRRWSLATLFAWTATTAIALYLLRPTHQGDLVLAVVAVAAAPVYGAAMLLLAHALWLAVGLGDFEFIRDPGHWLAVIVGAMFFGAAGMSAGFGHFQPALASALLGTVEFGIGGLMAIAALWLAAIAPGRVTGHYWQTVLRIAAVLVWSPVATVLGIVVVLIVVVSLPSYGLMMLVATIDDVQRRQRRAIPHWIGVAASLTALAHLTTILLLPFDTP